MHAELDPRPFAWLKQNSGGRFCIHYYPWESENRTLGAGPIWAENSIEIHGIPKPHPTQGGIKQRENTEWVVHRIGQAIGLKAEPWTIDAWHRLKPKKNWKGVPPEIIFKFVKRSDKMEFCRKKWETTLDIPGLNFVDNTIYITDNLSPRNKFLLYKTKHAICKNYCKTWTFNGKIFMKTKEQVKPMIVSTLDELVPIGQVTLGLTWWALTLGMSWRVTLPLVLVLV